MEKRILTTGHWIVDMNKRIDHWPEPTTLALIDRIALSNGGSAFNLAYDLTLLDDTVQVAGIGVVGDDSQGRYALDKCCELGIESSGIHTVPGAFTAFTDVMTERSTGRRTFFYAHGAMESLDESYFNIEDYDADFFTLGYLGMIPALDAVDSSGRNGSSRLFERASACGMKTAADLVSIRNDLLAQQVAPCLPHLDILFLNEIEASRLLGLPLPTTVVPELATSLAQGVHRLGVRGQVVLHYKEGAVVFDGSETHAMPCVDVPRAEIIGTAGAGDAFAAGYLLGQMQNLPTPQCLELASCSAAASLRAITCSDAITDWQSCLAYGRQSQFA